MIEEMKDLLNGGYNGLVGEVVTEDVYRLKTLDFMPEIFLDFGGNIGVVARYARTLFPKAKIVSVEPNKDNCEVFRKYTNDDNTILIEKAFGMGDLWRCNNPPNGAHEVYLSEGLGYPKEDLISMRGGRVDKSNVQTVMPDEIINTYLKDGMKSILKVDIEGGENIIWGHEPSMEAMRKADYICMEIHQYSLTDKGFSEVRQKTFEALASFIPTHKCEWVGVNFYAYKR